MQVSPKLTKFQSLANGLSEFIKSEKSKLWLVQRIVYIFLFPVDWDITSAISVLVVFSPSGACSHIGGNLVQVKLSKWTLYYNYSKKNWWLHITAFFTYRQIQYSQYYIYACHVSSMLQFLRKKYSCITKYPYYIQKCKHCWFLHITFDYLYYSKNLWKYKNK
jgi:hypothetical protein